LSEAFSFSARCETQAEIDTYWAKLVECGRELGCGWLKDKFGLYWQIVPAKLTELLQHPAAMRAMMKIMKFDIVTLEVAAAQSQ
jgi:predicted 3-demethylubiquinone-9 3-methyltransferase (glyoxalase superfamily)